jgi:alpha-galactosidase
VKVSRRAFVSAAAAAPLAAFQRGVGIDSGPGRDAFERSPARAILFDGSPAGSDLRIERVWRGSICRSRIVNAGSSPAAIREIVLFDVAHTLPDSAPLYGEGFQMLSQTGGTVGAPVDLGNYTDAKHYRMPQPADATVVYGALAIDARLKPHATNLYAFASCRRFVGRFELRPAVAPGRFGEAGRGSLRVVLDAEALTLGRGEQWELEELMVADGDNREAAFAMLAERLNANHPPSTRRPTPPTGWCSWYCFGPRVTAEQVLGNLDVIAAKIPALRYIQIDDGYQPAMGDWLETGSAFGGHVQDVLDAIRRRGFEPAIWVAPFIGEQGSHAFQQHPDWFIKGKDGKPLQSDRVTFGGWRRGPWYAIDGTHPGAQEHLERIFATMRREWGCTYFKLDANFWGAMHGGRFHDPNATRVEAYRRGMAAIRRGAGDGFVLGCNHPIWASLGLIDGSRSSNDIKRSWDRVATTARQNLSRNWQNGRLWWNDPDAVVLTGELTEEEVRFHATAIFASGGMVLSGDDLTQIAADRMAMLQALVPPGSAAARFEDSSFRTGVVGLRDGVAVCFLNWDDEPRVLSAPAPRASRVRELWTGEDRGPHAGGALRMAVPPHGGRVLVCTR